MLDPTLIGLIRQIENDVIVLPAMQRPFVWQEERIYRLIDSLLRGFPIGAIMLWKTSTLQRYRKILYNIDVDAPQIFNFETSNNSQDIYLVLDGQQRLTSLYVAFNGTYNHKSLFIDVLSGDAKDKDPGDEYYDCRFLTDKEASTLNENSAPNGRHFLPLKELVKINPVKAAVVANKKADELGLSEKQSEAITDTYLRCATLLGSTKSLQVIVVDEDPTDETPLEEVLEIFVRVNSGGLVLFKSDLLMSLLDLKWNDIQPQLQILVRDINANKPFGFTRDDVVKSLLLSVGAETRFDRLVRDRHQVEELAEKMPNRINDVKRAWEKLGCILTDRCKIYSERFFRGGHNALLPFVLYLTKNHNLDNENQKKLVIGIHLSIMSGIFSGAEARMGVFSRNTVAVSDDFPLCELAILIKRQYGIDSLEKLLSRHLDLALNIAHGGISLDGNPDDLQRDHIFPRSTLLQQGFQHEVVNHYANFHFLRGTDNANKSNKPPHEWFQKPGKNPPYTSQDLEERLLTWDLLQPGKFKAMLEYRDKEIRKKTEALFRISESDFNSLFQGQDI